MILILWFFFCGLVAVVASGRGRSAFGFFLLSVILSPLIGLIIALVVSNRKGELDLKKALKNGDIVECTACAEHIKAAANVCKHCGTAQNAVVA